jgi:hypothetical protein
VPDLAIPEPTTKPSTRWRRGLRRGFYDDRDLYGRPFWPLAEGEAHYFYWFIQGGIMNVDTRRALRRGWGLCERHAWAALAVEMCFRSRYLLGPAILYEDLLDQCVNPIPRRGPFKACRFRWRLRPTGPCMACDMRIYHAGAGLARSAPIAHGRRTDELLSFAIEHQPYWSGTVCGACGGEGGTLCRRHLLDRAQPVDAAGVERLRSLLESTRHRVTTLSGSYQWERRGTDQPEDRAALLTAIGWFSGWRPLLQLMSNTNHCIARADETSEGN